MPAEKKFPAFMDVLESNCRLIRRERTEVYPGLKQTSKMENSANIVND